MKAVVFDLDGTLVDTKYDMLDAGNLVSNKIILRILKSFVSKNNNANEIGRAHV